MTKIIGETIGNRYLIKSTTSGYYQNDKVEEVKVLELSPSQIWIKLMNMYGTKYWKLVSNVQFIEELKAIEKYPKETI